MARWVLPVPGGPRKTTFSLAVTKSRVPRWATCSRLRPRAWSKSNSSRLLRAGNRAARMRPSPPWASRAATSRCRQAARNSSWRPALGPGPLGQPGHRPRAGSAPSAPGSGRRARRSGPARRSWSWSAIRPPPRLVQAEGGVVVGQAAQLDLALVAVVGGWPITARRSRRSWAAAARWAGSLRVWWRAQQRACSATSRPSHHTRTRSRSAATSTRRPTDRRVDRVVVAVQAHVVVARQPQRAAPAGRWRDRRQRQHRGPVGVDPVGRGAAQHPTVALVDQRQPVGQLGVEVRRASEACGRAGTRSPDSRWPARPAPWPPDRPDRRSRPWRPAPHGRRAAASVRTVWPPAALADRALPVPHQHPRHRPSPAMSCHQPANRSSAAREGMQPGGQPAGIAGHHHQHRQPVAVRVWPNPTGRVIAGEPQVALGHLPSRIGRPRRRVRRQIHRPQLPHPVLEHRQPTWSSRSARRSPWPASSATPPAAPGSAARPHPRSTPAAAADTAAGHRRPAPASPCSSRHPITLRDRLDRHPLGPMQPADLRPVLHAQHPAPSPARLEPGSARGQLSGVV